MPGLLGCIFSPSSLQIKTLCRFPRQTDFITFTLSVISPFSPSVHCVVDHNASCMVWKSEGARASKAVKKTSLCSFMRFLRQSLQWDSKQNILKWWQRETTAIFPPLTWDMKLEIGLVVPLDTLLIYIYFCRAQWNIKRQCFSMSEDVTRLTVTYR